MGLWHEIFLISLTCGLCAIRLNDQFEEVFVALDRSFVGHRFVTHHVCYLFHDLFAIGLCRIFLCVVDAA